MKKSMQILIKMTTMTTMTAMTTVMNSIYKKSTNIIIIRGRYGKDSFKL